MFNAQGWERRDGTKATEEYPDHAYRIAFKMILDSLSAELKQRIGLSSQGSAVDYWQRILNDPNRGKMRSAIQKSAKAILIKKYGAKTYSQIQKELWPSSFQPMVDVILKDLVSRSENRADSAKSFARSEAREPHEYAHRKDDGWIEPVTSLGVFAGVHVALKPGDVVHLDFPGKRPAKWSEYFYEIGEVESTKEDIARGEDKGYFTFARYEKKEGERVAVRAGSGVVKMSKTLSAWNFKNSDGYEFWLEITTEGLLKLYMRQRVQLELARQNEKEAPSPQSQIMRRSLTKWSDKEIDFYADLGFKDITNQGEAREVSADAIKQAYRDLVNGEFNNVAKGIDLNPVRVAKLQAINDAYEVLKDDKFRAQYDRVKFSRSESRAVMTQENLQEMLSAMNPSDFVISEDGAQTFVYFPKNWNVVLKIPKVTAVKRVDYARQSYERAKAQMGGVAADFKVFKNFEFQLKGEAKQTLPWIIVQRKAQSNLRDQVERFLRNGQSDDFEEVRNLFDLKIANDRETLRRNLVVRDLALDAQGVFSDGSVKLIDAGMVEEIGGLDRMGVGEELTRGQNMFLSYWRHLIEIYNLINKYNHELAVEISSRYAERLGFGREFKELQQEREELRAYADVYHYLEANSSFLKDGFYASLNSYQRPNGSISVPDMEMPVVRSESRGSQNKKPVSSAAISSAAKEAAPVVIRVMTHQAKLNEGTDTVLHVFEISGDKANEAIDALQNGLIDEVISRAAKSSSNSGFVDRTNVIKLMQMVKTSLKTASVGSASSETIQFGVITSNYGLDQKNFADLLVKVLSNSNLSGTIAVTKESSLASMIRGRIENFQTVNLDAAARTSEQPIPTAVSGVVSATVRNIVALELNFDGAATDDPILKEAAQTLQLALTIHAARLGLKGQALRDALLRDLKLNQILGVSSDQITQLIQLRGDGIAINVSALRSIVQSMRAEQAAAVAA